MLHSWAVGTVAYGHWAITALHHHHRRRRHYGIGRLFVRASSASSASAAKPHVRRHQCVVLAQNCGSEDRIKTSAWSSVVAKTRARDKLLIDAFCISVWTTNSRHSLDFAFNKVLFKIFGGLSNDTYRNICNYVGICSIEEQIFARQGKFTSRYCASESDVCRTIGHLR